MAFSFFKKLNAISLYALIRMFYEAHSLGSNYVLQDTPEGFFKLHPVLGEQEQGKNQKQTEDQVLEAIRFKPQDQGVDIDRTVSEDGVCVQERSRVTASQIEELETAVPSAGGQTAPGQPYDSTQAKLEILGQNLQQRVFIGAGE